MNINNKCIEWPLTGTTTHTKKADECSIVAALTNRGRLYWIDLSHKIAEIL